MKLQLDLLNIPRLNYNNLGDNRNSREENLQKEILQENNKDVTKFDNVDSSNIETWEYVFKGMQQLCSSKSLNTYKFVMAKTSYGNLKTL